MALHATKLFCSSTPLTYLICFFKSWALLNMFEWLQRDNNSLFEEIKNEFNKIPKQNLEVIIYKK